MDQINPTVAGRLIDTYGAQGFISLVFVAAAGLILLSPILIPYRITKFVLWGKCSE